MTQRHHTPYAADLDDIIEQLRALLILLARQRATCETVDAHGPLQLELPLEPPYPSSTGDQPESGDIPF